jgi:hypothetical protein
MTYHLSAIITKFPSIHDAIIVQYSHNVPIGEYSIVNSSSKIISNRFMNYECNQGNDIRTTLTSKCLFT